MQLGIERSDAAAWRKAWIVLALTMAVRTVVAARYPLVPDETYFWEWSRSLAAGYFDHPPGIAWVIAAGTGLLGDTTLGVRLIGLACSAIAAVALLVAARAIGGGAAAFRAAVLFALLPLSSGLILATPDAPLAAAAGVTLAAALRAVDAGISRRAAVGWWAVAGLACGLGMATKLSAALLPVGIAIGCAVVPAFRSVFRTPGPYVAVCLGALVMLPVLQWNAQHDWIAFRFQIDHGFGSAGGRGVLARALQLLEFAGGQLLVTAVLPGAAMAVVAWRAMQGAYGDSQRFLAVMSAAILAVFAVSAMRRHAEPNWTAVAYPSLVVLLAASDAHARLRRLMRPGLTIAAGMLVLGYAHAVGVPSPLARATTIDPFARAYGWSDLADVVAQRAEESATGTTFIAADRYQNASQLAFHLDHKPRTFSLNLAGRANQYDYWPGFPDVAVPGDHLLVVLDEPHPPAPGSPIVVTDDESAALPPVIVALSPHFGTVERDSLVRGVGDAGPGGGRRLWILREWRGTFVARRPALHR